MKHFLYIRYLAYRVRRLIRRAEAACAADPALNQVAGEVYVGDIYPLLAMAKAPRRRGH